MLRDDIKILIQGTARDLKFPEKDIYLEHPGNPAFGDFSTNVAMQFAKSLNKNPQEIAKLLVNRLTDSLGGLFENIEVAGPGFINFFLKREVLYTELADILRKGERYRADGAGKGKKARVEYISANPTGPLHIGNARGGPLGDVVANVLEWAGYRVLREYYHNDVGGQVEKFGESLFAILSHSAAETQEYRGLYMQELAAKLRRVKSAREAAKRGVAILFREILDDSKKMGIVFDKAYRESDFALKATPRVTAFLKKKGVLKEKDGAVWFAPSDAFLQDRECVVVKSDGAYTYFANDIAYHKEKFDAGSDLVIDVLGATHHGHVPRLKAAVSALGFDPQKLTVILYQFVRVKRGDEVVRMAKRTGNFVTAREVLNEVGKDAFRFFMLMHGANTHMDFDLELAKKHTQENPVYYVQYSHARIASILKKSKFQNPNAKSNPKSKSPKAKFELLVHPAELALLRELTKLPEIIEDTAKDFQVQRLPHYAIKVADLFHRFYEECRVLSDDQEMTRARLGLARAVQTVIKNTLACMGVSAPERM